jgi:hypothetical protein
MEVEPRFRLGERVRSRVDGLYGVVKEVNERRGVLIYSVLLDDPSSVGPVYGALHEFEIEPADGSEGRNRRPLAWDVATFVVTQVKNRRQPPD